MLRRNGQSKDYTSKEVNGPASGTSQMLFNRSFVRFRGLMSIFFKKFFLMFYFIFERELGGGGESRETQILKQGPSSALSAQSLTWGSNPLTARL